MGTTSTATSLNTPLQPVHNGELLAYYANHSPITDPGEYNWMFGGLPGDIRALCQVVQGLHMHYHEGKMYGIQIPPERVRVDEARDVTAMLKRIRALDERPLNQARPPERRLVGCCRDFAVMLCAMLRHQGVPARVRFGFARYFRPGLGCDHVICEYWDAEERRWLLVDPQQDARHCQINRLTFDPHDIPHDQFPNAGTVWRACRAGADDPQRYIYDDEHRGMWVIQHYLVHELAALNKIELLIGDCWGLRDRGPDDDVPAETLALLDRVAELTTAGDPAFSELRAIYERNAGLHVPPVISSYTLAGTYHTGITLTGA